MTSNPVFESLKYSSLATNVFGDCGALSKELAHPSSALLPDEYEFYLLRVGYSLSHFLGALDVMDAVPVLLNNFRAKAKKIQGIQVGTILRYHAENYHIHTTIVRERSLALIDAVFHLLNDSRSIKQNVILSNLKVSRTEIPAIMGKMSKACQESYKTRNEIAHERSYDNPSLRAAEAVAIIEEFDRLKGEPTKMKATSLDLFKDFAEESRYRFEAQNLTMSSIMVNLLDGLDGVYASEKKRLLSFTKMG